MGIFNVIPKPFTEIRFVIQHRRTKRFLPFHFGGAQAQLRTEGLEDSLDKAWLLESDDVALMLGTPDFKLPEGFEFQEVVVKITVQTSLVGGITNLPTPIKPHNPNDWVTVYEVIPKRGGTFKGLGDLPKNKYPVNKEVTWVGAHHSQAHRLDTLVKKYGRKLFGYERKLNITDSDIDFHFIRDFDKLEAHLKQLAEASA